MSQDYKTRAAIPNNAVVRFAPSPTGPFHVGNIRTALVALRLSELLGLKIQLRVEDIDTERSKLSFQDQQLKCLEDLGYRNYDLVVQSSHKPKHYFAFQEAIQKNKVYPCVCSRQELMSEWSRAPNLELIQPGIHYTGKCRHKSKEEIVEELEKKQKGKIVWRFKSEDANGSKDFITGTSWAGVGDSGLLSPSIDNWAPSYNWACAFDDYALGDVLGVRAWDLVGVFEVQKLLVEYFSINTPQKFYNIFHTALVCDEQGHKLSKRDNAYLWGSNISKNQIAQSIQDKCLEEGLLESPRMGEKIKQINWKKSF